MKNIVEDLFKRALRLCPLLLLILTFQPVWANDATIILIIGKAEIRSSPQSEWRNATVGQQLAAGAIVRTNESSQLALLLRDQTQVRLNEKTEMEVKAVSAPGEGSTLSLTRGRMWAQVKQTLEGGLRALTKLISPSPNQLVRVNTPTATVGIRGTDWEMVVGDDGKTVVTVLSGEVSMANPQGSVSVGPNEQAVAEAGKAPVKSLLSNARDRVQWVTAYRPEPRRWALPMPANLEPATKFIESGDYVAAQGALLQTSSLEAALLKADLLTFQGRVDEAVKLLVSFATGNGSHPMAVALMSRALVVAGRLDEAGKVLAEGVTQHPGHLEIKLALADLARVQGDGDQALRLFMDVAAASPANHQAWFGVGRIETEKENLAVARKALDKAIDLAPSVSGYLGERATLEALAGDPAAARLSFTQALDKQPDDYLALTGLGILQLKSGETEAALTTFLKAGLIEPRYARVQLYSGVAYYQLGNRQRALESVSKAAELDAKDPLPYVMLGMMRGDALELRAATDAARQAQERMPFLKSLNQLLNNQKGSSNVGSALAAQGMEEWAHTYAADSYSPFWAGSALFLADRYPDGFNKNSELYRGFLLDPTVFGASNRFSSLVASPGHYGSIGLRSQIGDFRQNIIQLSANGLAATTIPFSYSIVAEGGDGQANPNTFQSRGGNLTLGLGARPNSDIGVFYFGTSTDVDGHYSAIANPATASLTDDRLRQKISRHDVGLSYRINPSNLLMAKLGSGQQSTSLNGNLFHTSQANSLNATFVRIPALLPFNPAGRLNDYSTTINESDAQFSQRVALGDKWTLAWGYESAAEKRELNYLRTFDSRRAPLFPASISSVATRELNSADAYASLRGKPFAAMEIQADVQQQKLIADTLLVDRLDLTGIGNLVNNPTREHNDFLESNFRLGLALQPAQGHKLRLVRQQWRKPVGNGTLGLSDTLGIPVEDRLVDTGGLMRRSRLQYDWQASSQSFYQFYMDHRTVTNLQSASTALFRVFGVAELDSLRARKPVFGEAFDDLERVPVFGQGEVASTGLAGNWLLTQDLTLAARYKYNSSSNTAVAFSGRVLPLVPEHFANLSAFWQVRGSWLLALSGSFRTSRFTDEANTNMLGAGWVFGITSFWETDDKRWSVEAGLTNLHPVDNTTLERDAKLVVNAIYRF